MARLQLRSTTCAVALALLCLTAGVGGAAPGQQPAAGAARESAAAGAPSTAREWAEAAAQNELSIIQDDGTLPLRYRIRKVDAKGDTTREVIETREGAVARMIERNGQPLTAAEDAAERQRLKDELASPEEFRKKRKRADLTRHDSMELVRLMPEAMINTFVAGQPQPPGASSPQVVVDFHPDPAFKPPSMLADVLTGFAGRTWIDAKSRRVTRIEAHVLHPVNFGWGILGRIYPGGTLELEQVDAGDNRWVYSHVDTHLTVRVVVKTMSVNDRMTASDFHLLATPVSFEQGIHMLQAMPVQLR
jgi:hypothetical protein